MQKKNNDIFFLLNLSFAFTTEPSVSIAFNNTSSNLKKNNLIFLSFKKTKLLVSLDNQ